ncbi:MAG: allophanate hydrolase subunit 1 [Lentilitoribacter sp.]
MMQPKFKNVSDCGVLVELGSEISDETSKAIFTLDKSIAASEMKGVVEVVPALVNLLVIFDPLLVDHSDIQHVIKKLFPLSFDAEKSANKHLIDICYDKELAPDLTAVANACGLSEEAVINAHLNSKMHVSMYGFAPGYAYMSGLAKDIQIPRKKTALRDVPAGSIIIAGQQCLITTLKMPTGWSIIGRTHTKIITEDKTQPFLFNVGDEVSFNRISLEAYLDVENV